MPCVTHHICDCKQQQLESLLAERERMLDLLERWVKATPHHLQHLSSHPVFEAETLLRQAGRNQPKEGEHVLAVAVSERPGQWVECSCGWASPDLAFPTDEGALEYARIEHLNQPKEAT